MAATSTGVGLRAVIVTLTGPPSGPWLMYMYILGRGVTFNAVYFVKNTNNRLYLLFPRCDSPLVCCALNFGGYPYKCLGTKNGSSLRKVASNMLSGGGGKAPCDGSAPPH